MIKVGIVGASGYSGVELVKLLLAHPEVEISFVSGTQRVAGKHIVEIHPSLRNLIDLTFLLTDVDYIINSDVDCVFLATPNETSLELVPLLMKNSDKKIIDLSGSFRFNDASLYPEYYGFENDNTDILAQAVYGLPEINKAAIREARLLANPGCYPTSVILALAPLLKAGLIDTSQKIIIDSKSGVTGAGRQPTENTHYVEANESMKAYKVHGHRHEPEIVQELSIAASVDVKATFTPHLLPVNRGILSTIYAQIKQDISSDDIQDQLEQFYKVEKFVRVLPSGLLPEIKYVANTNFCDIGFSVRESDLILVSCIDNLLKGASSQAVQNLNLMFGFKENLSL
ncbi:MAG: N-acetyl-gamma-glutamyl-phosphate reductase [Vampirovibrionia bacterium]